ncbi:N-acetylmuramoyl-L-alanine amidase, partial [Candidatus Sumerlaeota bacterium]|nr:N-acetylmuramoyl-L-alanine amidase [Candidatus Sumerlaeota bacterium]
EIVITAGHERLSDYIPRLHGGGGPERARDAEIPPPPGPALVRHVSPSPITPSQGLEGRHIALWHSHGWYHSEEDNRWTWQRPRMFTAVEDKLPMSFVLPFLVPMLENAGAVTLLPRERDFQTHEVIVDDESGADLQGRWTVAEDPGFQVGLVPLPKDVNPHAAGHHSVAQCVGPERSDAAVATWVPEIPADGDYAVTACYGAGPDRATDAAYVIRHAGGISEVRVNQRMGGHTWVYLGTYAFHEGRSHDAGSVSLVASSADAGATVSADAVRLGGGTGIVEMGERTSGYPRVLEATQYVLQHAGAPPEHTYRRGEDWSEYTQDYAGRGEWVNWLRGAPNGPNSDRDLPGERIPVDLSFAWHTDAGIRDGIVGTLVVHWPSGQLRDVDRQTHEVLVADTEFPDGRPRWLNRELADLIQSQIVEDIRASVSPNWTRRALREMNFAETRTPNVPAALLELASHQNFEDQTSLQDPRFRFLVSRAIYKGMLRWIASENGFDPIVAPLAPTHLAVEATGPGEFHLSWQPESDPLEPTAEPEGYLVYHREGGPRGDRWLVARGGGFGEPTFSEEPEVMIRSLDPSAIHCFRVTAINHGGESFPTTTLAAAWGGEDAPTALLVDAFDRIAPPRIVDEEGHQGFDRSIDRGVGYGTSHSLTGDQWSWDPAYAWSGDTYFTNDDPGHGASSGDLETETEVGNLFDHAALHVAPLHALGFTVHATTDEALRAEARAAWEEGGTATRGVDLIDWVLGEERTTPPPPWAADAGLVEPEFPALPAVDRQIITEYLLADGRLILSGAHWATDVVQPGPSELDESGVEFLQETLGVGWRADQATTTGEVRVSPQSPLAAVGDFTFESSLGRGVIYGCESPDAIEGYTRVIEAEERGEDDVRIPMGSVVLRYARARFGAAVLSQGPTPGRSLSLGFPLECIGDEETRQEIFAAAVEALMGD